MDALASVLDVDESAPKVCAKRFFNSVAWPDVSVPLDTCVSIRLEIFDCSSSGEGGADEDAAVVEDAEALFDADSELSMESIALVSAVWSVEETEPDETSDCNCCNKACAGV